MFVWLRPENSGSKIDRKNSHNGYDGKDSVLTQLVTASRGQSERSTAQKAFPRACIPFRCLNFP